MPKAPKIERPLEALLSSDLVKKIRKQHGEAIFTRASEFGVQKVPRIPTGIFMLDYALGGGFPVGRVNVVWGHKSAAKTTTFLKTIAQAQQRCSNCWALQSLCACGKPRDPAVVFLDVEGGLDLPWAEKMGVDTSRVLLSIPEYAEQTLDMAESVVRVGCDILVIDSIAFLTPAKEIAESTAKETVGIQARAVGKGVRKFVSALNAVGNETGRRPTLFFTNQVRMKVGVMFGSPETQPGGMAPGFASSTEVKLSASKYEMDEITGKPLTAEFNFRVEKNKVSAAKIAAAFKMILSPTEHRNMGDISNEHDIVRMAEKVGLVEGSGSSWMALGEKFRGRSRIEQEMLTNPEFLDKMWHATMSTLLG